MRFEDLHAGRPITFGILDNNPKPHDSVLSQNLASETGALIYGPMLSTKLLESSIQK